MADEQQQMSSAQEDYQYITEFCERFGVPEEKREKFISSAMESKGYKRQTSWGDPDPEPGQEGEGEEDGGLWAKRKERQQRVINQQGGEQKKASGGGSNWMYE